LRDFIFFSSKLYLPFPDIRQRVFDKTEAFVDPPIDVYYPMKYDYLHYLIVVLLEAKATSTNELSTENQGIMVVVSKKKKN
jgi:hypothetical protein